MINSDELLNKVKGYNKFVNLDRLNKAYHFAVKAHSNQKEPLEILIQFTRLK